MTIGKFIPNAFILYGYVVEHYCLWKQKYFLKLSSRA
ncbi:MAG: hypothetical protein JWP12_606 [Bacteroidetes bacterium]|nr:hypothetical protein [Bacteroidota bacterium]